MDEIMDQLNQVIEERVLELKRKSDSLPSLPPLPDFATSHRTQ